jgi:hypothetical protein
LTQIYTEYENLTRRAAVSLFSRPDSEEGSNGPDMPVSDTAPFPAEQYAEEFVPTHIAQEPYFEVEIFSICSSESEIHMETQIENPDFDMAPPGSASLPAAAAPIVLGGNVLAGDVPQGIVRRSLETLDKLTTMKTLTF